MFADYSGLPDHNTCSVIDAKVISNAGGRMDVYTGLAMGMFRNDTGYPLYTEAMQGMRHTVGSNCIEAGIRLDYFTFALGCGITFIHGYNIAIEFVKDLRQGIKKFSGNRVDINLTLVRVELNNTVKL